MKATSLSAGIAIKAVLTEGLGKSVTRVTPVISTEDATMPFVVYRRTELEGTASKSGRSFDTCAIELRVYTKTYGEGIAIAERIRELLEYKNITCKESVDGIDLRMDCGRMVACDEGWDNDSYVQSMTLECKIV